MNNSSLPAGRRRSTRGPLLIGLLVILCVLVPFLFWRSVWFGQSLSDEKMEKYLRGDAKPRQTQHALVQVAERIIAGDPGVQQWYPYVVGLAAHPQTEIRLTAAWAMGQDNNEESFRHALKGLLSDSEPLVRRNAALSLVRFQDASGKPMIQRMLQDYTVTAPQSGIVDPRLKPRNRANPGTLLARIHVGEEQPVEIRSPLPGVVEGFFVERGDTVEAGQPVARLSPAEEQVWEALRALFLIGDSTDLSLVERYARGVEGMSARIQQQAVLTAQNIRARAAETELEQRGRLD